MERDVDSRLEGGHQASQDSSRQSSCRPKHSLFKIEKVLLNTLETLPSTMNAKLIQQEFWHCCANSLVGSMPTIPHI